MPMTLKEAARAMLAAHDAVRASHSGYSEERNRAIAAEEIAANCLRAALAAPEPTEGDRLELDRVIMTAVPIGTRLYAEQVEVVTDAVLAWMRRTA